MDLSKANDGLSKVKIQVIGESLYLRGTFPPKPGEVAPKQRRIALGFAATPMGLKAARIKALSIEGHLLAGTFTWEVSPNEKTCGEWIKLFEQDYWKDKEQTVDKLNTFKKEYLMTLNKLPHSQPLSPRLLEKVIKETPPETRVRVRVCRVFTKLAKFAGLGVDFKHLSGGYKAQSVDTRSLPSDQEILVARERIKSKEWLNVFDLMAVYGLRNHEVFFIDWEQFHKTGDKLLWMTEGKTGSRLIYPMLAKGWDGFDPWAMDLPDVDLSIGHNALGWKVSNNLRRHLPFNPYSLRHCWARRAFEKGLPADFCAKAMGHALSVHLNIYRRFWGDEPYRKIYEQVTQKDS